MKMSYRYGGCKEWSLNLSKYHYILSVVEPCSLSEINRTFYQTSDVFYCSPILYFILIVIYQSRKQERWMDFVTQDIPATLPELKIFIWKISRGENYLYGLHGISVKVFTQETIFWQSCEWALIYQILINAHARSYILMLIDIIN